MRIHFVTGIWLENYDQLAWGEIDFPNSSGCYKSKDLVLSGEASNSSDRMNIDVSERKLL